MSAPFFQLKRKHKILTKRSVNEIFDPDRVSALYSQSPASRAASIALDRGTNYGVVRLTLLEHLYEKMYMQRLKLGNDSSRWPHQILHSRHVVSASSPSAGKGVVLQVRNAEVEGEELDEVIEADYVFVATGYRRDAHEQILKGLDALRGEEKWDVGRDYRVRMSAKDVAGAAGIWLQGCNEGTHGVSSPASLLLLVNVC